MRISDSLPWHQPTLAHALQARVAATPLLPAYREYAGKDLPWKQLNWQEAGAAVMRFRCALQRSAVGHGDRVGIWLPNSIHAMCMDQANLQLGVISVPVHTTDNPASIAYIFDNAEISLLVLSNWGQWERLRATEYPMNSLRTVVIVDMGGALPASVSASAGGCVKTLSEARLTQVEDAALPI